MVPAGHRAQSAAALPIFGGCAFINAPEPEPTPTKVPEVHVNPDVYKPVPVDPAISRCGMVARSVTYGSP